MYLSSVMAAPPFQSTGCPGFCEAITRSAGLELCSNLGTLLSVSVRQRGRWKAGRSPITPRKRGVSLEHGPACRSGLHQTASSQEPKLNATTHRRQQSVVGLEPCRGALQGARRCCHQRLLFIASFDTAAGKPNHGSYET